MTNTDMVHHAESMLPVAVCSQYWSLGTDHDEFGKILQAIYCGGGRDCNVPGILQALHGAGFRVTKQ